jgi:hypothetical protein
MISTGLLWFDDDARRPLPRKIADALDRYRDRTGYEPTTCLVNPAQAESLHAPATAIRPRTRRASAADDAISVTLPPGLHIQPSEALSPNYIMVGIAADETPRPAVGRPSPEEEYEGTGTRQPRAAQRGNRGGNRAATVIAHTRRGRPAEPPPARSATPSRRRPAQRAAEEAAPVARPVEVAPAASVRPVRRTSRAKAQPADVVAVAAAPASRPPKRAHAATTKEAAPASAAATPATPAPARNRRAAAAVKIEANAHAASIVPVRRRSARTSQTAADNAVVTRSTRVAQKRKSA